MSRRGPPCRSLLGYDPDSPECHSARVRLQSEVAAERIDQCGLPSERIFVGEGRRLLAVELHGVRVALYVDLVVVPRARDQRRATAIALRGDRHADVDVVDRAGAVLVEAVRDSLLRIALGLLVDLHFEACVDTDPGLVVVRVADGGVIAIGDGASRIAESDEDARVVVQTTDAELQAKSEVAERPPSVIQEAEAAAGLRDD